jgi:hypothetical protein
MGDMVFYRRYGKTYVRRRAKVNNPDTPAQRERRAAFRNAIKSWQGLGPAAKERWNSLAGARGRTGYNAFISACMARTGSEERTLKPAPVCTKYLIAIRTTSATDCHQDLYTTSNKRPCTGSHWKSKRHGKMK